MNVEKRMKVIDDALLGSFLTTVQDEDLTKVSLVVDVSPTWLQMMKGLCTEVDSDFAPTVESILHKFYHAGLNAVLTDLQERYHKPKDILEAYMALK